MLRWFPTFQVATTWFSCSPPDLNLLVTNFTFCVHIKQPLPPGDNPITVNKYYTLYYYISSTSDVIIIILLYLLELGSGISSNIDVINDRADNERLLEVKVYTTYNSIKNCLMILRENESN